MEVSFRNIYFQSWLFRPLLMSYFPFKELVLTLSNYSRFHIYKTDKANYDSCLRPRSWCQFRTKFWRLDLPWTCVRWRSATLSFSLEFCLFWFCYWNSYPVNWGIKTTLGQKLSDWWSQDQSLTFPFHEFLCFLVQSAGTHKIILRRCPGGSRHLAQFLRSILLVRNCRIAARNDELSI